MKIKKMKIILPIVLAVIIAAAYIFMSFFIWHGKSPIGYYQNKQKGMYNTKREFGYHREGEVSYLSSLNDWAYDTRAYENSEYVYVETYNKLIQYTKDGELISEKKFSEDEYVQFIYCGENYVYLLTENSSGEADFDYSLWVLEAKQIEKTVDIGEVKEENAAGAFVEADGTVVEHKSFETVDTILYYDGEIEREDVENEIVYRIKETEFEPVMVNKSAGNRIFANNTELTTENLLAVYDNQIYSWNDGMVEYSPEFLEVYRTDSKGDTEVIYESETYKPISARVSGSTLMILGEDFYKMPMTEGGAPYLTGDYRGAILLYYDMDEQKMIREYKFEDEQIVYMNIDAYARIHF